MFVKKELIFDDMPDFLWGAAREKWINATEDQRQMVWDMLEDSFYNEIPEEVTVNDAVAYDCDDIFFPEDEEENESFNRRRKLESRIKRLEKMLSNNKNV
jgi:hypothetical protein